MRKINLILIILIIINIFAFIIISFYEKKVDLYKSDDVEIENINEFIEVYRTGPSVERYTKFIQAIGEQNLPGICEETKDFTSEQLESYYTINKDKLIYTCGINNKEDFFKIIDKVQIFKNTNLRFKKAKIKKGSCILGKTYTSTKIKLYYSKNKTLSLNIQIANTVEADKPMFIVQIDDE